MVVYLSRISFTVKRCSSLRLTRRLLTRQRESQIKGYFHRHGFKILVSGRFVPGFRTAAYLTAGILKLPPVKLLLTDIVAASLSSTFLMFGLGYALCVPDSERNSRSPALGDRSGLAVERGGSGCSFATTARKRARASPSGRRSWIRMRIALSIDDLPSVHHSPGVASAAPLDRSAEVSPPHEERAAPDGRESRPGDSGEAPGRHASFEDRLGGGEIEVGNGRRAEGPGPWAEKEIAREA